MMLREGVGGMSGAAYVVVLLTVVRQSQAVRRDQETIAPLCRSLDNGKAPADVMESRVDERRRGCFPLEKKGRGPCLKQEPLPDAYCN